MKRKREEEGMDIVWQTPANPPERQDYIFRNGIRYVRPYYFEFIAHVKNRWAGKTIVDMFAEEFKGRPYEYYVSAVKCGRIQVDGEMVPVSYIVKSSQKISHFLHRHEPPVMAYDVSVLQKEPDVVTVCKPASVPVHPCGQYRKNTIVGILQAEYGLSPLFPVHRLDRLVSGLLVLARNAPKADIFRQQFSCLKRLLLTYDIEFRQDLKRFCAENSLQFSDNDNVNSIRSLHQFLIEAGLVKKQYIAKVVGEFPEDEQVADANISYNAREGRSVAEIRDSAKGKTATTKFRRISSNGAHSIVFCEPITGRTHQIRVHLQYLGHPIANDMLYLSEQTVDQSSKGTGADSAAFMSDASPVSNVDEKVVNECEDNSNHDFSIDPMCTNCPNLAPKGYDVTEEGLWLHCIRYSGPGWTYECPYPDWAKL